ncbi:MAG TPA: ABC transporter permease [Candidatus Limnocylindria bacterium]|nr:ABC transporter permease [Candidatus Limnocylindria bacterium]
MIRSWPRVGVVARRELLTTVRRKAFILTVLGTPAYFVFVMWLSASAEMKERRQVLKELDAIALVDSSGLYAQASGEMLTELRADQSPFARSGGPAAAIDAFPAQSFRTEVRSYPDLARAEAALRAKQVSQVLVVPADYLHTGQVRRYARSSSLFSSADRRAISAWLARNLIAGRVDSLLAARAARPAENEVLYTLNARGQFELKDENRELVDFMLPLMFTVLLGLSITLGGQYLLQGVAEEKESRILESLLCTMSPEELMAGKLVGLGAAGLLVVAIWVGMGLLFVGPTLAMMQVEIPAGLLALALVYFVLGYLFFGSLMIGIGAVTNHMREAQQFAVWFTFANFVPLILITSILGRPNSPLAVLLSLLPPTAPTTMMMRMTAPSASVPPAQIVLSLALLAATALLALLGAARVFRIGLLMYGKTPSLPEILRWARRG